ncbi:MAG: hypothetical protein ABIA75_08135 [Candidatus Neomarinimicrobiota bacterium]
MLRRICIISLLFFACQPPAVVKPDFDFETINRLSVAPVRDIASAPGSGEIIYRSLVHQLLRSGIQVVERNDLAALTNEAAINQSLAAGVDYDLRLTSPDAVLICTINEFTDGNVITIPVITEDKGRTVTTTKETKEPVFDENDDSESEIKTTLTEETTKYEGTVTQTQRLEYIDSRVGVTLQMVHLETGEILWSNAYRYNSLSMAYAVDQCVHGAVNPLKKVLF